MGERGPDPQYDASGLPTADGPEADSPVATPAELKQDRLLQDAFDQAEEIRQAQEREE